MYTCYYIYKVCDGILDCPIGESTDGGEDENVCSLGSGDFSDNAPSTFFDLGDLNTNGVLNFEDFVDVGREIPGIDNFVETSPGPTNFQDVGTEPTFSNGQEDLSPSIIPEIPTGDSAVSVEDMCHIKDGQSNIVLDMFESFGDDFSQRTNPVELPVMGTLGQDINLELVFPSGNSIFRCVISFS